MKERVMVIGKVVLVLSLLVALFPSNVIADPFETARSIAMKYGKYDKLIYRWEVTTNRSPLSRYSISYDPRGTATVTMTVETDRKKDHLYRVGGSSSSKEWFDYHRLTVEKGKASQKKDLDKQFAFEQANKFLDLVAPYIKKKQN